MTDHLTIASLNEFKDSSLFHLEKDFIVDDGKKTWEHNLFTLMFSFISMEHANSNLHTILNSSTTQQK